MRSGRAGAAGGGGFPPKRAGRFLPAAAVLVATVGPACGSGRTTPTAASSMVTVPIGTVGCGALSGVDGPLADHGSATAIGSAAVVEAGDDFFTPTCIFAAASGGRVTVRVTNHGRARHNVSVPEAGIDRDLPDGASTRFTVEVLDDPVVFFCRYHRAGGMSGVLLPG